MSLSSVYLGTGSRMRVGAVVLLAVPIVVATACKNDTILPAPAHYTVQLTTLTPSDTVGQDSSLSIPAIVIANGDTVTNATTSDSSLNPTYLVMTDNGLTGIRGTPPGSPALVLVTYQDVNNNTMLADTVSVVVRPNPLASISLSIPADSTHVTNNSIAPGETRTVQAVVLDSTGDTVYCNACAANIITASGDTVPRVQRVVRWSTPDTAAATITSSGDLTADSTVTVGSTIRAVLTVPGDSGVVANYSDTLPVIVIAPTPLVTGGTTLRAMLTRPHARVMSASAFRKGSGQ